MTLLSPAGIGVKTNGRSAWLDAPAAASYQRMIRDGCPTGGITDAGRTHTEQWDMWRKYLRGELDATAAYPGTSKHETGRALDLAGAALAWVRAHGREYGWLIDQVKNERWHVEYHAEFDKHAGKVGPPAPTPSEEDDMTPFIIECYRVLFGREPDLEGLASWTDRARREGLTAAGLIDAFRAVPATAEPGSVSAAYRRYLPTHRDASPAEQRDQLARGYTVGALHDAVKAAAAAGAR